MDAITTAGLEESPRGVAQPDMRKLRFKAIREALFRQDATDSEREDALEALAELSKD